MGSYLLWPHLSLGASDRSECSLYGRPGFCLKDLGLPCKPDHFFRRGYASLFNRTFDEEELEVGRRYPKLWPLITLFFCCTVENLSQT